MTDLIRKIEAARVRAAEEAVIASLPPELATPAQQAEPVSDDEEGDTFHGRTGIATGMQQAEPVAQALAGAKALAMDHQGGWDSLTQLERGRLLDTARTVLDAQPSAQGVEDTKPVLVVLAADLERLRKRGEGDASIRAWLPPSNGSLEVALYAAPATGAPKLIDIDGAMGWTG